VMPLARERGMGVIVMKALGGGSLTTPAASKRSGERDPIVAGCLRYALSHPAVSLTLVGMESSEQVEENAAAIEESPRLTDQERRDLIAAVGGLGATHRYGQTCLRCGYCLPCAQGIEIPEVFRALHMARQYPRELKHLGRELYASLPIPASACVECEGCMPKCPAGLTIPERLKEAVAELEESP